MSLLSLGFSPCPNDTFIFAALVNNWLGGTKQLFEQPLLEDVETLNRWAFKGRLDVTKLSFHAAGHVLDEYCILPVGGALGRGCGPLLVARQNCRIDALKGAKVAIPGVYTTAALLFEMYLQQEVELVEMRFDHIMPAIAAGEVAAGVIIHESRFTYQDYGLVCRQDLGQWWEDTTGLPIPLGCIAARRSIGTARIEEIERRIAASLDYAWTNPDKCMAYIQQHAQETALPVIRSHIELYVNDFSAGLGEEGRAAIQAFFERGRAAGKLPTGQAAIFGGSGT